LRRCTDVLLVLHGLLFVLQWASRDVLMLWGAKINPLITGGQWWRLITCSFLHTSLLHLAVGHSAVAEAVRRKLKQLQPCWWPAGHFCVNSLLHVTQ
jgi:hypothetical protein